MIESLTLAGTPCFGETPITLGPLKKVNFYFGPNGSGKTTLGRALADARRYNGSTVSWRDDEVAVRTYNRDYIDATFGPASGNLPGVFLLGEASIEVHDAIARIEGELKRRRKDCRQWETSLGSERELKGKLGEIATLRHTLRDDAWRERDEVPQELQEMFAGTRSSKERFFERLLSAAAAHQDAVESFDDLVDEAVSAFDTTSTVVSPVPEVSLAGLDRIDGASLLGKPLLGSSQVELAPLIEHLGNSDWVRHGQTYLDHSEGLCPFCQQHVPDDLLRQLEAYFDRRYLEQLSRLQQYAETYRTASARLLESLHSLPELPPGFVDPAAAQLATEQLENAVRANLAIIDEKLDQPSSVVSLAGLSTEAEALNQLIRAANASIARHNAAVTNRAKARTALIDRCWRTFVRGLLAREVATYEGKISGLVAARDNLIRNLDELRPSIDDLAKELKNLRSQVTSSQTVIDHVNEMLGSINFTSFQLAPSQQVKDGYMLIRADGTEADIDTLSEGERTFITFLYFYHQLLGVRTDDGESEQLVAVIDDPVSSLDSDILHVVTALIRRLMRDIHSGKGRLSQLHVLTHNLHFHHDVTFRRRGDSDAGRQYFRIRKHHDAPSAIENCGAKNPLTTNYRLLWDEVVQATTSPTTASIGLQNIMRRILENYFKVMGGIWDETLDDHFDGEERLVYQSLVAWVNDGSHTIVDSVDFSPSEASTAVWLRVFQEIFKRTQQEGHFLMMMGRLSEAGRTA